MVKYYGYKNGKHNLAETDEVLLQFRGPDAEKFVQVFQPECVKRVLPFELTENEFLARVSPVPVNLRQESVVESAAGWEIGQCEKGHTLLTLVDRLEKPSAELHIGKDSDLVHLIFSLMAGRNEWVMRRLNQILAAVNNAKQAPQVDEVRQPELAVL